MADVDWYYHRKNCTSCERSQTYLTKHKIGAAKTRDARKETIAKSDALTLVKDVDEIYSTKGRKVIHLDVKGGKPTAEQLEALLIGPSGNLRAPTFRKGRTLVVGFDEEMYGKVLK